jgi:SNF2 family DNA or RNA helicase
VATADVRESTFAEKADAYVTNIDAVKWLAKQPKSFFAKFDTLIIDESSAYKHATSQRSKAVAKIAKYFKYKRAMTGTPNGRTITDVWHQVYLLDEGARLGRSFFAFRNSVCTPTQVGCSDKTIRWDDKDGAEEAVFGLLSDIVIRHKFEDCVDIPANHRYTLEYELSAKQRKAYEQMETTQMLWLKGKEPSVIAVNAAVVANKLLQVASGAVYGVVDDPVLVDDGRYKMVLDLVEERKHSLVFFHWKHQRDALAAEADKRGITFAIIDGTVNEHERDRIVTAYQAGAYQTIFAHPRSAAHGLTLTRGTTTIWASPTDNTEWFKQGNRRQARRGQTQATRIVTVIAEGTVDEAAYSNCIDKGEREDALLGLFQKYTIEEFA